MMQESALTRYLFGASLYPIEFATRQIATLIAKKLEYVDETTYEHTVRTFQQVHSETVSSLLPREGQVKRFVAEKTLDFISNQAMPALEELLCRVVLQDYIIGTIGVLLGLEDYPAFIAFKIILSSLLFGLVHIKEAELMIKKPIEGQVIDTFYKNEPESIQKLTNLTVVSTAASGLVYGSVYHYAGFFGSFGTHMMWNAMVDALKSRTWNLDEPDETPTLSLKSN